MNTVLKNVLYLHLKYAYLYTKYNYLSDCPVIFDCNTLAYN